LSPALVHASINALTKGRHGAYSTVFDCVAARSAEPIRCCQCTHSVLSTVFPIHAFSSATHSPVTASGQTRLRVGVPCDGCSVSQCNAIAPDRAELHWSDFLRQLRVIRVVCASASFTAITERGGPIIARGSRAGSTARPHWCVAFTHRYHPLYYVHFPWCLHHTGCACVCLCLSVCQ
jgi:hypothetical protein